MELKSGIYESLIYEALKRKLEALSDKYVFTDSIDSGEAPKLLTNYVAKIINSLLSDDSLFETLDGRFKFVNDILNYIDKNWQCNIDDSLLTNQEELLSGIVDMAGLTQEQAKQRVTMRPLSGFTVSNLFTGSNTDLSIDGEIERDIQTADEIYWIVAFVRFSGVRIFENALREFLAKPNARLRLITTTYMGASEPKAVDFLKQMAPNKVEIKISYNCDLDRLHAKSYIFVRDSGMHTAYIGSSNVSRSALTKGLEWNMRITNQENTHIIQKALATFDTYWNSDNFEDYDYDRFVEAIAERNEVNRSVGRVLQKFHVLPHQKAILDKLTVEREIHQSSKNLIVAATGTGKTVIAAFDYKRFYDTNQRHRLLFVAHRKEILEQSVKTFCSVLGVHEFGELWVGDHRPSASGDLSHLFISIQSFNSNLDTFRRCGADYYDYIVVDEAHHSEAISYQKVFDLFTPKILIGLTATPERADGVNLSNFNQRIAAELRLPEAIDNMLLSPFQYFCVGDRTTDLSHVAWAQGGYDENELVKKLNTADRLRLITESLPRYLADEHNCRALCFCARLDHARDVAAGLCLAGYRADMLSGEDSLERREKIVSQFRARKINYLCVVDIYNEGVDIPEIDTVLFLRPTKSLTIFLQQLGRGLRLAPDKECLTVLDFVAQAHVNYSYESRFRALIPKAKNATTTAIKDAVAESFTMLPRGCTITMDKLAREYIISNIKSAIFNLRRLVLEVRQFRVNSDKPLNLPTFLAQFDLDIRVIYKTRCWSALLREAGMLNYPVDEFTRVFEKNMSRLIHVNSVRYLGFISKLIDNRFEYEHNSRNNTFALMLYYDLFAKSIDHFGFASVDEGLKKFGAYPLFVEELRQIIQYLSEHLMISTKPIAELGADNVLELFGCYTREEQLAIFSKRTAEKAGAIPQSGVFSLDDINTELLWVTLNKSDKDFSPSTQYEDYAINEALFNWQSQNSASHQNSGRRYVEQRTNGRKFLLFVREHKVDEYGFTSPYYCLGLVDYVKSHGDKPMTITWAMQNHIPGFILDKAQKMAVG